MRILARLELEEVGVLDPGTLAIALVAVVELAAAADLDDDSEEVCGAGTTVVVIADILPDRGSLNLYIVKGI